MENHNFTPDPSEAAEVEAKDAFFAKVAEVSEEMIAAFGRDFAMGVLILAARYIAQNRPPEAEQSPAEEQKPQIITQP